MRIFAAVMTAWLMGCAMAAGQEPAGRAATRADLHFVIGWQNLHKDAPLDSFDDWLNDLFYGGAGVGWYWTDKLKAQVDFGAGTHGRQFRYEPIGSGVTQTYQTSRVDVRQSSIAIGQQYQFFHNQWFHPHVGAGVDIARETTIERYDPVFGFDPVTRTTRQLSGPRTEGPDHDVVARPFVETGFKAYMTRRSFFTGDMRLMAHHGIDEVLFRMGFGIDF